MDFGVQFFPSVGPETTPAVQYFDECLKLCGLMDEYGYSHVRTVEDPENLSRPAKAARNVS